MSSPAVLALIAAVLPFGAQSATYRCTDSKGRTTLQDFPCATPSRESEAGGANRSQVIAPVQRAPATDAGSPPPSAGSYSSARGAWRGPAQFHITTGGQRDLSAHRIAPLVIELAGDGKVTGVISEAGCRLSGLTTQFVKPTMANIDVTLTACADGRFNTRMSGMLTVHASAKEAKLRLSNIGYTPSMKVQRLTLDAVLRR